MGLNLIQWNQKRRPSMWPPSSGRGVVFHGFQFHQQYRGLVRFFMFNPNAWHGQRIPNKNPNAVCKDSQKKWLYGPCNVVPKYSVDRKLHFRVFRQIAAWPARRALPFQSNKNLVQICSNQQINANNSKQHSQLRLMWIQNAKPRTLSSPIQQEHFDFSNLLWRVQSDDYSSGTCPESHSLSSQKIRPNLMH